MSKKKNPLIVCPKCSGEGMVELGDELMEVLRAVRGMKKITAPKVLAKLDYKGSSPFAINNRLAELTRKKFFTRKREGRVFVYTQIKY